MNQSQRLQRVEAGIGALPPGPPWPITPEEREEFIQAGLRTLATEYRLAAEAALRAVTGGNRGPLIMALVHSLPTEEECAAAKGDLRRGPAGGSLPPERSGRVNLSSRVARALIAAKAEVFRRDTSAALPERMRRAAEAATRSVPAGDLRGLTSAILGSLPPDFRRELLQLLAAELGTGAIRR